MDKLALNNQIISMRHEVRRAKVYTIHKLVRELRRLKSKNGSEEQKKKNNRKAERFKEEILIIKKLKDDEISKFALCNTKMCSKIIADPAASLIDKAFARLSSQSAISTHVDQFRTKFPTWDQTVPQLLNKLGKKKKKKKNKEPKICKNEQKKGSESSKQGQNKLVKTNNCTNDRISESDQTVTSLHADEAIVMNNEDIEQEIPVAAVKISKKLSEKTSSESFLMEIDNDDGIRNKMNISKKSLAEVKTFTEHLEAERSGKNDKLVDVDSTPISPEATTVDPFFVHEDGETEYLTSVKVDRSANEVIDTHKEDKTLKQSTWDKNDGRRFNRAERRKIMHGQKPGNSNFKTFKKRPPQFNSGNESKQSSSLWRQKGEVFHPAKTDNDGPVHPSWEAKKKLKEQQNAMFAFQGKKIKFE